MNRRTSTVLAWAVILGACAASIAMNVAQAQQGDGSIEIETVGAPDGQVVPTVSWTTTPAGATCAGSGDWSGAKGASGSETLPAATPPLNFALSCTWPGDTSALIRWTAPTENTDGSSLTNLAGYRLLYGTSAQTLTQIIQVPNAGASQFTVEQLTPGQWFFAAKAYNSAGVESSVSNVATKTARPGMQWTASVGVKVPNPPSNVTAE